MVIFLESQKLKSSKTAGPKSIQAQSLHLKLMLQWQEHFLFLICHSHLSSACWRVTTGSFCLLCRPAPSSNIHISYPVVRQSLQISYSTFSPLSSHGMSGQDVIVKSHNNLVETSQTWEQAEQPCCFAHLLMTLQCDKTTHVCFTEGNLCASGPRSARRQSETRKKKK